PCGTRPPHPAPLDGPHILANSGSLRERLRNYGCVHRNARTKNTPDISSPEPPRESSTPAALDEGRHLVLRPKGHSPQFPPTHDSIARDAGAIALIGMRSSGNGNEIYVQPFSLVKPPVG